MLLEIFTFLILIFIVIFFFVFISIRDDIRMILKILKQISEK